MADDLKYGYKGAEPTQSFGNNTGVFDPNDINNLIADNKWTTFGQLELIETQTSTNGTSAFNFLNLGSYNVHFVTFTNCKATSAETNMALRFSNNGGTSWIATGYQFAYWFGRNVNPLEQKSTNSAFLGYAGQITSSTVCGGYFYVYNLLDSSKYSFASYQSEATSNTTQYSFGSGVLPTAETHNALQVTMNTDSLVAGAVVSLYGIRYS